jgi:acyl-CoA thioesterase I
MIKRYTILLTALVSPLLIAGCHLMHAGNKVAFLGDSLTQGWSYPKVNYGIFGNTTAQMLERFPKAIANKGYTTVVILGGTNDVLLKMDPGVTIEHLEELGNDTVAQHAEPILCEIPPIFHSYILTDKYDYSPAVIALNQRIAELAAKHHWRLIDYYSAINGHSDYSSDGVHMKRRGYLAMERAALHELPAM